MASPRFQPESSIVSEVIPSPNHDERRDGRRPDMILLHYTGMRLASAALERLSTAGSDVSSHYLVFEDGRVVQLVQESRRAWHAGVSSWSGETDINSRSIGIEIANPGHDYGYPDFPRRQIAAVTALCRGILTRHTIAAERVLAHSDVAPSRKQDPGEKFPWRSLFESGVGNWVQPASVVENSSLSHGDRGEEVASLQGLLSEYGYGIAVNGDYDTVTQEIVTAFQRHFRPGCVDGVADVSTLSTLKALLRHRGRPRSMTGRTVTFEPLVIAP